MADFRFLAPALALVLGGCSSGDMGSSSGPAQQPAVVVSQPPASPTVVRSDLPPPAAHTGADGYPNINVDTAAPTRSPVRTAEERDRLEAELMALGARQRSNTGATPQSVVQELQELGRRSKADALRQIESGAVPASN